MKYVVELIFYLYANAIIEIIARVVIRGEAEGDNFITLSIIGNGISLNAIRVLSNVKMQYVNLFHD